MVDASKPLLGWGYQGRFTEDLVAFIKTHQVGVVVDVRLNPISRKRGFSKRSLSETVETAGAIYLHRPALGNPRDNREGFAMPFTDTGREAHSRFTAEVLETEEAHLAIYELSVILTKSAVALPCYEADESCCHRHLIAEAVGRLRESVAA